MSVDKFRFVSPGIFTAEIDDSRLPAIPAAIGPVVIGRTLKGPAMRPVQVQSIQELERVFGAPHNGKGGGSGDVWREGSLMAPTYATYAAKAFLRNSGPVTLVRTIPTQHDAAASNSAAKAGWAITKADGTTVAGNAGAWGLFVAPASGTTITGDARLAAVFYTTASAPGLVGASLNGNYEGTTAKPLQNAFVKADGKVFTLIISGSSSETVQFHPTDSSDAKFIRRAFNTDPTRINNDVTATPLVKSYFLGETFEGFVKEGVGEATQLVGLIAKLPESSDHKHNNQAAASGWVVSQHAGPTGSFVTNSAGEYPVEKLFRFKTLTGGDWEQANIKISIENIRASTNTSENPYGTFDVVVRNLFETNTSNALERFQGVDLNPNSDNYIAKVIGDLDTRWDYSAERYVDVVGTTYTNNSAYIKVEVSDVVKNGAGTLLPYGFYGPPRYSSISVAKNVTVTKDYVAASGITGMISASLVSDSGSYALGSSTTSISLTFPSISLKATNGATTLSRFRFGLVAEKATNGDLKDILSAPNATYAGLYEPAISSSYSTFFSLDDVIVTGSNQETATWASGNRYNSGSYTTAKTVLDYVNDFDLPLFGGASGYNVLVKESVINNELIGAAGYQTAQTNCAINTLDVALKAVSDPEVVEMNVLAVPGVQKTVITNKVIEICENRADTLAIVDLEGDYKPSYEAKVEVAASAASAVTNIKNRLLNTSYACSYFPAVFSAAEGIYLPSSVAALGVMGGTEKNAALWFAPAGFNRGGLNVGNAGIAISRTAVGLTSRERDSLYQSNINPIATFPAEGVVIFGQKTLQTTPSALDRINVRRLLIYVKKQISRYATQVLFDPNVEVTWKRFKSAVEPFLAGVKSGYGLDDFRVELDERTTTADLVDRNVMYAKILLKPTRTIEFIALDFVVKNSGASFDD
jgi:hypothetical protein